MRTPIPSDAPSTALLPTLALLALLSPLPRLAAGEAPREVSGIYPHLAYFNGNGECGTGAVVPWADRLWVISYGPHLPHGSDDKLYEIDDALTETARPESVGGTPANRLIHRESNQLFIGPYAIDAQRTVRAISPKAMPGRLTGSARHLTDPAGKIYTATMEEGFYEIDVKTLAVTQLYQDANGTKDPGGALLPGWHGKGLYSGQGRLVYANNGEHVAASWPDPRATSGSLDEWDGKDWTLVRRNQFTEVTGPGGIYGNADPANDPIWSIGWDDRSLILELREHGAWQAFRLPKASHTYDGSHGWHTEWPRIRDIGPDGKPDLLMTMHGMFWRFPQGFRTGATAGIRPRSSYLKVIGDFCRWHDRVVLGCDDSAKSEFLNKRPCKGDLASAGQSQSNLWFVAPEQLDRLGPTTASGAVWQAEAVSAGQVSDPFLFAGWPRRAAHLANGGAEDEAFVLEVDARGDGRWSRLDRVVVKAHGSAWRPFTAAEAGEWVRVTAERGCPSATVQFTFAAEETRGTAPDPIFAGLAPIGGPAHDAGLVRALGGNRRTMALAAMRVDGQAAAAVGGYELDAGLALRAVDQEAASAIGKVAIPKEAVAVDAASVLLVDERKRRWRLPKGPAACDALIGAGLMRVDREVSTERDVFDCHGTFYELPAESSGGFAKIRPISSHRLQVMDYCSYRGLLVMTGVADGASGPRIVRSDDGKAAVWVGAIDDLWRLGRPTGTGGPWKDSTVGAGVPSDPYLFAGYDRRRLELSHAGAEPVAVAIELDLTGFGLWVPWKTVTVPPGAGVTETFPAELQARWVRLTADHAVTATARFVYE
jgi:hypothetical protein